MSKFVIDLHDSPKSEPVQAVKPSVPELDKQHKPKKRSVLAKVLAVLTIFVVAVLLIGGIGGYFYWQSLKKTPQYSLALIIDAARRDDQATIDGLIDINAIVDDFLPQVTNKAIELYGRGLPPQVIARVSQVSAPVLPAIKDRAREELPRVVREKTEKYENVPFAAMVLGADRYLDITIEGDTALVKSKIPERPLELKMKRNGDRWQIVGIKDEQLATRIAQKIGQEIIAIASKGGIKGAGEKLGIKNLQDILKQAEDIFK